MGIENINGPNKSLNDELPKIRSQRIAPSHQKESVGPIDPVTSADSRKTEANQTQSNKISDIVEISSKESQGGPGVQAQSSEDSVEISWQDPEMLDRIKELIERIRSQKEVISQRVEAARVLILERAYDKNDELRKTAEAVLRGEMIEDVDLSPNSDY